MLKKIALISVLGGLSSMAMAAPFEGFTVKVGASVLDITGESDLVGGAVPKASASDEVNFTPSIEYRFANTPFSAEVLLALPFKHDVTAGGTKIASVKHLPPTITAKYNLDISPRLTAYAGAGVTVFVPWDEELSGAAKAALGLTNANKLEADVAVGPAAQLGFNYKPDAAKNWGIYGDVRYADLKTDLEVTGVGDIGSLDLDPLVYTIGYVFNF